LHIKPCLIKVSRSCSIKGLFTDICFTACWEETNEEEIWVQQLQDAIQKYLAEYGADKDKNHTQIETDLLHLAMYRPLTRVAGFGRIASWDLTPFRGEVRDVLRVQVLEPVEQCALVDGATVVSTISPQNASVGNFYTSRIFPLSPFSSHPPLSCVSIK
jgi:hypothetical protein